MINREEFLLASAQNIAQKGWNEKAFDDPLFPLLFPDGLLQAADVYFRWTLKETFKALEEKETSDLKTFAKIRLSIITRFEVLTPYKGLEKRLFFYLARHPRGIKFLYDLINETWYWAGDKSLDYNFYTKRLLLACVYVSTFLTWIYDSSPDLIKTQQKLDQRLSQVGHIPKIKERIKSFFKF